MAAGAPSSRAAFITGGSSGIGLALAGQLAASGHDLALIARDPARLETAKAALLQRFRARRVEIFPADVGRREACGAAVGAALDAFGAPAFAIANAGVATPGRFLDQPVEDHEAQMATNYFGSLYFARALAPAMAAKGGGKLVFVSSGAAFFGIYGYSAYAPSKFALRGLAEVLRVELAPHGIGVTVAYPPDTDTPQLAAEALTKPPATKAITAGGGLFSAERVAAAILAGARRNRFVVAPGFQMAFLNASHSLLAPALRLYQASVVRRHG
ncbi:MAG: SDR family oxidoreductase [Rhizobiaceae bacterium]